MVGASGYVLLYDDWERTQRCLHQQPFSGQTVELYGSVSQLFRTTLLSHLSLSQNLQGHVFVASRPTKLLLTLSRKNMEQSYDYEDSDIWIIDYGIVIGGTLAVMAVIGLLLVVVSCIKTRNGRFPMVIRRQSGDRIVTAVATVSPALLEARAVGVPVFRVEV